MSVKRTAWEVGEGGELLPPWGGRREDILCIDEDEDADADANANEDTNTNANGSAEKEKSKCNRRGRL